MIARLKSSCGWAERAKRSGQSLVRAVEPDADERIDRLDARGQPFHRGRAVGHAIRALQRAGSASQARMSSAAARSIAPEAVASSTIVATVVSTVSRTPAASNASAIAVEPVGRDREAVGHDRAGVAQRADGVEAAAAGRHEVLDEHDAPTGHVPALDPPPEAMALGLLANEDRGQPGRERERAAVGDAGGLDAGDDVRLDRAVARASSGAPR